MATFAARLCSAWGEFRPVIAEALFIEMEPAQGRYEPLIGYIPLEQAQAVVDLAEHRLAKSDRVDLKAVSSMPRRQLGCPSCEGGEYAGVFLDMTTK